MSNNDFSNIYSEFMENLFEIGSGNSAWNEEEYGDITVYYEASVMNMLFSMLFADGFIQEDEVYFLNSSFGFDYDTDHVQLVYANCRENLDYYLDTQIEKDIDMLKSIDEDLSEKFKKMLSMACNIIIESDGVVADAEKLKAEVLIQKITS